MGKVLCTGSSGFIASHLVDRLRKMGEEVTAFDIADGQDICNLDQVSKAIEGKDTVFHLAAVADLNWAYRYPVKTMEINVQGTWNIAQACLKSGAILDYASTMCVYGNQKTHPDTEESMPNPSEIYACSKMAGENVIKGMHHSFGLKYNMMRFATIYGPGCRSALGTHIFLGQALRKEPITVHGDGTQTRTLTYVDDLVDAVIALHRSGKKNDVWNMSAEEEISANRMAVDIRRITLSKSKIVHIDQRIGQTFKEQVSAAKMLAETGWKAQVSWEDGIERMKDWFIKTDQINNLYKMP